MTPTAVASRTCAVSPERLTAFHRDGFLVLERLTTAEDLERIGRLLARLYQRFYGLARQRRAHDLGAAGPAALPQILEINQVVDMEPALEASLTFARCRALAETLLGRKVEYRFDHTIYKPAFNGRSTPWHQDEAYTLDPNLVTAHFWVPLQDVTLEMGCMQFIPGSHREAVRPHHRRDHLSHAHMLETDDVDTTRAVACPLRLGDATVHFPRTLHYTGPNATALPRLAWALEFGPRRGLGFRLAAKTRLFWRRAARASRLSSAGVAGALLSRG